jgi:hypothetical protein
MKNGRAEKSTARFWIAAGQTRQVDASGKVAFNNPKEGLLRAAHVP